MEFIPISQPSITEKEISYVSDAVASTWVSSIGEYINTFEDMFAEFCGTKYALTTSSGTTALHLSLLALGITFEDEVIVPNFTFVATASAVKYIDARLVLVDVECDTLCIDPNEIEKAITERTKAIVPVHLYGHPANMRAINAIAKKHGIYVIEDAAEAHGAEEFGVKVGALGDAGVFSFYGNKLITSGEGGMITTDDELLYKKMKHLRDHAMSLEKRYWHTDIGFNYRMTNMQAALGVAQFERIDELLLKKETIFDWYHSELSGIDRLKLNASRDGYRNVYWMVCIEVDGFDELKRDGFISRLKSKGIDSRPYFYPVSDMPMFDSVVTPVTHDVSMRGVNLPSYFDITREQVRYVCDVVKKEIINALS